MRVALESLRNRVAVLYQLDQTPPDVLQADPHGLLRPIIAHDAKQHLAVQLPALLTDLQHFSALIREALPSHEQLPIVKGDTNNFETVLQDGGAPEPPSVNDDALGEAMDGTHPQGVGLLASLTQSTRSLPVVFQRSDTSESEGDDTHEEEEEDDYSDRCGPAPRKTNMSGMQNVLAMFGELNSVLRHRPTRAGQVSE